MLTPSLKVVASLYATSMTNEPLKPHEREQRIAEMRRHLLTLPPHHAAGTRERLEREIAALEAQQTRA